MNDLQKRAADTAHGAVVGKLRDPEFEPAVFVTAEVLRHEEADRGRFLHLVAVAAVSQHAGTLLTLKRLGLVGPDGNFNGLDVDPAEFLARAAELRNEEDTHG